MAEFTDAPEVERMIRTIVDSISEHAHLDKIPVRACFRSKAKSKVGKTVLATASIVTGRNAFLARPRGIDIAPQDFYLIEVAADQWELLNEKQRIAVIDHELMHCPGPDSKTARLALRGHDIEEFTSVLRRHGCWKSDLVEFVAVARQLELFTLVEGQA